MPHTPGPWTVYDRNTIISESSDSSGDIIAEIWETDDQDWDEAFVAANARLISAAPELLRACEEDAKRIRHLCGMVNDFAAKLGLGNKVHAEDWDDMARAAIASATGKGE